MASIPITWLDQPIVHTTRHGWEVVAAQPWTASSIPLARKGEEVLGLNRSEPLIWGNGIRSHQSSSRETLERLGFGSAAHFRSLRLGHRPIGYLFYGQRENNFGLPFIGILGGPGQRQGLGTAALMALIHGVHQAGGIFEILEIINPWAFQSMLTAEGFGDAEVHLVRNELLIDDHTRARGMAAYPRKQVALRDFEVEEATIPPRLRHMLTEMPTQTHAWWMDRIVVKEKLPVSVPLASQGSGTVSTGERGVLYHRIDQLGEAGRIPQGLEDSALGAFVDFLAAKLSVFGPSERMHFVDQLDRNIQAFWREFQGASHPAP